MVTNRDAVPKLGGNDPVMRLCSTPITSILFQSPTKSGIVPVNRFWFILKYNNALFQFSNVTGNVPWIWLSCNPNNVNDDTKPISDGIVPSNWLLGKKMVVTSWFWLLQDTPILTIWLVNVGIAITLDHWHSWTSLFMKLNDCPQDDGVVVASLSWLLVVLVLVLVSTSGSTSGSTCRNRPPVLKYKTANAYRCIKCGLVVSYCKLSIPTIQFKARFWGVRTVVVVVPVLPVVVVVPSAVISANEVTCFWTDKYCTNWSYRSVPVKVGISAKDVGSVVSCLVPWWWWRVVVTVMITTSSSSMNIISRHRYL